MHHARVLGSFALASLAIAVAPTSAVAQTTTATVKRVTRQGS